MLPHCVDANISAHLTQVHRWDPAPSVPQITGCEIWRPWTPSVKDRKKATESNRQVSKDMQGFNHPVRLFMPRSKIQDYLSHLGKKVLASFPVQATLHFYNDDSDSENEDDDETEGDYRISETRTALSRDVLCLD